MWNRDPVDANQTFCFCCKFGRCLLAVVVAVSCGRSPVLLDGRKGGRNCGAPSAHLYNIIIAVPVVVVAVVVVAPLQVPHTRGPTEYYTEEFTSHIWRKTFVLFIIFFFSFVFVFFRCAELDFIIPVAPANENERRNM